MSTTQSAIAQPELIANMLSLVPSSFRYPLSSLITDLPPEEVDQFINLFTDIFNFLPTTLPEELTTLSSENSVLPPHLLALVKEFTDTLNTVHSYLLTIVHLNLPSPNLSHMCSDILDDLHFTLYIERDIDIPTRLTSLRNVLHPMPLTHASSGLQNMVDILLEHFMIGLYEIHSTVWEALQIQPDAPPNDLSWFLVDFIAYLDIESFMQRFGINQDDNTDAEDYDLEELSIKYVHQARTDAETDPDNCRVCLEDMKDGENARRLRCLHTFHVDCIDHWLEMNDTCPICRTHIYANHEIEANLNGVNGACSSDS